MIVGIALMAAIALIAATGGSLRALTQLRFQNEGTIVALFITQALFRGRLGAAGESLAAIAMWSAACAILMLILLRSHRIPGVAVVVTGLALNMWVTLINQGMPYAWLSVSQSQPDSTFYRAITDATAFAWLGDVLPDPTGQWLFSAGDMLLLVGVIVIMVSGAKMNVSKA